MLASKRILMDENGCLAVLYPTYAPEKWELFIKVLLKNVFSVIFVKVPGLSHKAGEKQ